jgi:hypothetical protein
MANSLSVTGGKSFFKDGKAFEEFCLMPKADREKILNGEPVAVPEVDEILDEVKKKATEHKKKGVKK